MIEIRQVAPEMAYEVSLMVDELQPPYSWEKWKNRLRGREHICLVALEEGEPAGCKIGYFEHDHFYSWVGGVRTKWRRQGIASKLAERLEEIVREKGVDVIRMKTWNRFRGMLLFAIRDGFDIVDVEREANASTELKIVLEKKL